MHAIKRLDTLTREEVRVLALAAADRGDSIDSCNPFAPGTDRFDWFQSYYRDRQAQLSPA